MKNLFFKIFLFILTITTHAQTTQDSLYVWKAGVLINKQSIKPADMDSITFKRPPANLPHVTICSQVWSTKNLDVTSYSDGTAIPQVTDATAWSNLTTGAWCYYNNDAGNNATYGKLYNWYAAAGIYDAASLADPSLRKRLAPTGWHVPTDNEWTTLIDCLGGLSIAGGKMKAIGTLQAGTGLWQYPNTDATNTSGFTALPGGNSYTVSTFGNIGFGGNWWSLSSLDTIYAWDYYLDFDVSDIVRNYEGKRNGFSVRCVRD